MFAVAKEVRGGIRLGVQTLLPTAFFLYNNNVSTQQMYCNLKYYACISLISVFTVYPTNNNIIFVIP